MENRRTTIPALRPPDDTDVTTWELPEGAIGRLGQGVLLGVEYSSDGAYLAIATKIGFWIYDTATMIPRALWGTERGMFNVATFSHDMRWIATGDQDGIVKIWDTQNGQCVTKIDSGSTRNFNSLLHLHFSQDGQHLATSGFAHSAVYTSHLLFRLTVIISLLVHGGAGQIECLSNCGRSLLVKTSIPSGDTPLMFKMLSSHRTARS